MPRNTIYKGDMINNFGRNFPVPYIERVELYNVLGEEREDLTEIIGFELGADEDVSKVTMKVSMLFNTDDDFMLEGFVDDLFNDLHLNFLVLTNEEKIGLLKDSKRNLKSIMIDMSSDTEGAESTGTDSVDPDTDIPTFEGLWAQVKSVPLSTYSADIAFTGEYDEHTNKILKSSNIVYDLYIPDLKNSLSDLTIFVATSVGSPSHLMDLRDVIMAMSFSDLAYEDVKKKGMLDNKTKVGFFDENNAFYPGRPLVSLNGDYYKSDDYDQEAIKKEIDDLMDQYEQYLHRDRDLQNVFDNLDVIYHEYGETPIYLAQLNRYRSNIMNQDVTTFAGKFYERYRILLNNANTKLLEHPRVFKRITYASKIRDFRPSQFAGELTSTFDDDLTHEDFLYRTIFQTNVAKYVSAHSDTGESTLFQPEAPYTPGEMKQSYIDAISMVFTRFHAAGGGGSGFLRTTPTGTMKGTDNVEVWIGRNSDKYLNEAKDMFKCSIGKFIAWATSNTYSCDTWSFGEATSRRIYRGGYGGLGSTDADERESLYNPGIFTDSDLESEHNIKAFRSAQRLFGHHGIPDSGCTLEFGYDAPKVGDGWYCDRVWAFDDETRTLHTELRITQDSGATAAGKYSQYKCFTQQLPIINIVGHGSSDNADGEDIDVTRNEEGNIVSVQDPGRFGNFLRLRDRKGSYGEDWNLKYPRDIMDLIDEIMDQDFGQMSGMGGGYGEFWQYLLGLVAGGGGVFNNWINPESNDFVQMVQDEEKWNSIVAEYDLLNSDGEVRNGKLNTFAEAYADDIYDIVAEYFRWGDASTTNRTYRLRWCPDTDSDTDWIDSNRDRNNNPYGGKWSYLWDERIKRAPDGTAYGTADEGYGAGNWGAKPFYWSGGCGQTITIDQEWGHSEQGGVIGATGGKARAGIGRAKWNLYETLKYLVINEWHETWRSLLVDAIKDVVPLLAELHGLNVSTGLHRRLAYMDVVVSKYGWFFFDLEKYIQKQSVLSRYMDPRTLERYFDSGRDMINRAIRIDDVTFWRWNAVWDDSAGIWKSLRSSGAADDSSSLMMEWNPNSNLKKQPTDVYYLKFESSCDGGPTEGKCAYAKIKQMDVAGWSDICLQKDDSGEMQLLDAEGETISSYNYWSFLMHRNFDFAFDDRVPDNYRLACYAYNYFIDDDVAISHADAMKLKVTVRDRSDHIITYLRRIMFAINEDYQEYVELARENCAYNKFDSQFNQFFINHMDEIYTGNMEMAPWLRAPAAYVIFQDLMYGFYGGEWSVVLDAARNISDRINPYTGDLESVEEYSLKLNEMMELLDGIHADMMEECFDEAGEDRTREYREFYIGKSGIGGLDESDIELVIDKGIIDYASDHTSEFPDMPDASRDR